jgi:hypothetical protein
MLDYVRFLCLTQKIVRQTRTRRSTEGQVKHRSPKVTVNKKHASILLPRNCVRKVGSDEGLAFAANRTGDLYFLQGLCFCDLVQTCTQGAELFGPNRRAAGFGGKDQIRV